MDFSQFLLQIALKNTTVVFRTPEKQFVRRNLLKNRLLKLFSYLRIDKKAASVGLNIFG